jgi:hypothetical protein
MLAIDALDSKDLDNRKQLFIDLDPEGEERKRKEEGSSYKFTYDFFHALSSASQRT